MATMTPREYEAYLKANGTPPPEAKIASPAAVNSTPARPEQGNITAPALAQVKDVKALTNPTTGKTYSATQQAILEKQRAQLAGEVTPEQAAANRDKAMGESLASSKTINRYTFTDPQNIAAQQGINQKYKLDPMTGLTGTPIERNIEQEKATAEKMGLDPNNQEDIVSGYEITYGSKLPQMIASGAISAEAFSFDKLKELGLDETRLQKLVDDGYLRPEALQQMLATAAQGSQAGSVLDATPKPTNEMMGVLSEALNAKNNFKKQNLGTSDLFKMAGLSGYDVLSQSLGQRSQEMAQRSESAANLISKSGGAMASTYKAIADNYNAIRDDYDKQMNKLLAIDADAKDYEQSIEIANMKFENDKKMETFKSELKIKEAAAEKKLNPDVSELYAAGVIPAGSFPIGDKSYKMEDLQRVFDVGGTVPLWCGEYASTLSTGPKVGNTWAEKQTKITHREMPQPGNKLLIPLGVKTDGKDYGHVATVLSYDDATKNVYVVEANRGGEMNRGASQSKVTVGVYNLEEMQDKYGSNWGFTDGKLKDNLISSIGGAKAAEIAMKPETYGSAFNMDYSNLSDSLNKLSTSGTPTSSFAQQYLEATGKSLTPAMEKSLLTMTPEARADYLKTPQAKTELAAAKTELAQETTTNKIAEEDAYTKAMGFIQSGENPEDVYNAMVADLGAGPALKIFKRLGY